MSTYHIYVKASKTPTQTYPAGLEAESSSTSIMCACARMCVCVCVQDSSTRKTLVCASIENYREIVRSLESALICVDFYNSSKLKYIYTYCMHSKKKLQKTYENINLSFFENKKT